MLLLLTMSLSSPCFFMYARNGSAPHVHALRKVFMHHTLYVVANAGQADILDDVDYKGLPLRTFRLLRQWPSYECSWYVKFDDDTFFFPEAITRYLEAAPPGHLFTGYKAGSRNGIKVPVGGFYAIAAAALSADFFYKKPQNLRMGEDTYAAFELARHNVTASWWYPTRFLSAKHTATPVADFVAKCILVAHWVTPTAILRLAELKVCFPCAVPAARCS